MHAFIAVSIYLLCVLFDASVEASVIEEYHYLEKTGSTCTTIAWRLEKGDYYKLTVNRPGETYVCLCNLSLDTYQWEAKKPAAQTEVVARREKNSIVIEGTFQGEAINKEVRVDGAPWYQAMTLSLRELIVTDRSSVEFWTIRFDNLSPYKMKASKKAPEGTHPCESEVEVEKVKVSLTGLKALLWDCSYWFSRQNGVFVRYEGRSGPPGYPMTVIELAEEEGNIAKKKPYTQ